MIDLKKNHADTIIIRFADGTALHFDGPDAQHLWTMIRERNLADIYTSGGRYIDTRFTMAASLLPFVQIN